MTKAVKLFILFFFIATTMVLAQTKSAVEQLVQKQLDAYNAQNIDAFVATYSPTIKIYEFPNKLTQQGLEELRTRYTAMFKKYPQNHSEIVNRTVQGNFVIDQEKVTGRENILIVTAIYEVKDGLIENVWFLR